MLISCGEFLDIWRQTQSLMCQFSSNVTIDNLLLVVDANAESLLNTKVNILNNIS